MSPRWCQVVNTYQLPNTFRRFSVESAGTTQLPIPSGRALSMISNALSLMPRALANPPRRNVAAPSFS
eukprot:15433856-Alexandrium_andersonii.AAC.1